MRARRPKPERVALVTNCITSSASNTHSQARPPREPRKLRGAAGGLARLLTAAGDAIRHTCLPTTDPAEASEGLDPRRDVLVPRCPGDGVASVPLIRRSHRGRADAKRGAEDRVRGERPSFTGREHEGELVGGLLGRVRSKAGQRRRSPAPAGSFEGGKIGGSNWKVLCGS